MSIRPLLSGAALLLLLVPGCASSSEESGPSEDDIQGGQASKSYLAVGLVKFKTASSGTGTLIRPNVVLTAGHIAIGSLDRFYYGSPPAGKPALYTNLPSVKITGAALGDCYRHPAANGYPEQKLPPNCIGDIDIGLVKLEKPIADVTPLRIYEGSFDYLWKAFDKAPNAVAVGFGCHTLADNKTLVVGERRSATSIVSLLTPAGLTVEAGTGIASSGDSGGPLLYNGFIIGTVLGGDVTDTKNACARQEEWYTRIDTARAWINTQLKAWGAL